MFKIFYLPNCSYSIKALNLLTKYNLVSEKINCDEQIINSFNGVPENYTTYPKILYKENDNNYIFIGGCNELEKLLDIISKPLDDNIPAQKYLNKKQTCKILLELVNKIK